MQSDDMEHMVGRHRRGAGRGRGRGRGKFGWAESRTTAEERARIRAWIAGRLPPEWGVAPEDVRVDDDEILVTVQLSDVEAAPAIAPRDRPTAEGARIAGFREESREHRMRIAEETELAFGRVLSWGARCGASAATFTTASVPVMTRLRIDERVVLDTLVDAGVARSRSEALAWCVRLVGKNEDRWISDLRVAFEQVEQVRSRGPGATT